MSQPVAAPIAGTTTANQYNPQPASYTNSYGNTSSGAPMNLNSLDLERLNTLSTILGPSGGTMSVEPHKRFRDFGNPSPLGLSAFALTTMVLSLINVQARGLATPNIVVGLALFYGGLVQLLAGMWEFACGNTFAGVALSSYGGFWLSFGVIFIPGFAIEDSYTSTATQGKFADAVGVYLICWAVFTFLLLICTMRSTVLFFSLFLTLDVAFVLLAVGYFREAQGDANYVECLKAGGYFGIFAAALAWLNALSGIQDKHNSFKFMLVPLMPFPWSESGRVGRRSRTKREKDTGFEDVSDQ